MYDYIWTYPKYILKSESLVDLVGGKFEAPLQDAGDSTNDWGQTARGTELPRC